MMSRFPAVFRLPAFASWPSCSRRGIGPSSRSAYRHRRAGPRRGYRVPHTRATTGSGVSSTPGTAVLIPKRIACPAGACRFTAASPYTPRRHPHPAGLCLTRHQRSFTQFTPPAFPSRVAPGWNGSPRAFPRASHPADQEPDDARRGGDRPSSTGLEQRLRHQPNLQSCVFTRDVRLRVARLQAAATNLVSGLVRLLLAHDEAGVRIVSDETPSFEEDEGRRLRIPSLPLTTLGAAVTIRPTACWRVPSVIRAGVCGDLLRAKQRRSLRRPTTEGDGDDSPVITRVRRGPAGGSSMAVGTVLATVWATIGPEG